MNLSAREVRFLTALSREHNQTGCRGPAHELLRQHAYSDIPLSGAGSLAFSYEALPLIGIVLKRITDLDELDRFLCKEELIADPEWPWASAVEYRARLEEARRDYVPQELSLR
jgi:hypothetical protein